MEICRCLWWKGAVEMFLRVWLDIRKSLERESAMMFYVSFMCCEYRDVSLITRFQPIQRDMKLCDSSFTGSKYALFIQPSALKISVNTKMCEPCPSCRMVMYIDIADASNSNRFSVSLSCHYDEILYRHAKPLSLYPPMPNSQASAHIVTVGLTKTMLLIGTPMVEAYWRNLFHSWGSWRCHSWRRCDAHYFPLFSKWRSRFKNYRDGGMTCAA